jgi:putative flippase GtrA
LAGNWFSWRKIQLTEAALQLFYFGVVGGATFVIYFALQILLAHIGVAPLVALSIAYLIAVSFHYTCNRVFTFRWTATSQMAAVGSLARYAVVNVVNYGITLVAVQAMRGLGYDIHVGMVVAIIITLFTGYMMYKFWVFH